MSIQIVASSYRTRHNSLLQSKSRFSDCWTSFLEQSSFRYGCTRRLARSSAETRIQGACIVAERCVSRALTIVNRLQVFIYNLLRFTKIQQQLRNDWLALLLQIGSISGLAVIALFLKRIST